MFHISTLFVIPIQILIGRFPTTSLYLRPQTGLVDCGIPQQDVT